MDSRFSQQTASVMSDIDDVKETVEFINDRFETEYPDSTFTQGDIDTEREKEISLVGASIIKISGQEDLPLTKEDEERMDEISERISDLDKKTDDADSEVDKAESKIYDSVNGFVTKYQKSIPNDFPHSYALEDVVFNRTEDMKNEIDNTIESKLSDRKTKRSHKKFYRGLKAEREKIEPLRQEFSEKRDNLHNLYKEHRDLTDENNKIEGKYTADKIRRTISKIRDMGGSINTTEGSDPELASFLNEETSKNYPSAWIEHHNKSGGMSVSSDKGKEIDEGNGYYVHSKPDFDKTDGVPKSNLRDMNVLVPSERTEAAKNILNDNGVEGIKSFQVGLVMGSAEGFTFEAPYYTQDKPSDTTHWTHQVHHTQGLDYIGKNPIDEGESVSDYQKRVEKHMNDNPVWVLNDGHTYTMNSHIHVDKTLEGVDSTDNVLTHEMGHRMENVIPDDKLTRMESAFIRRRSPNNSEDNLMASMYGYISHQTDVYTSPYSSRAYPNKKEKEIFTTGMESVFYGKKHRQDEDHQAFTVGCLAVL